MCRRSRVVVRKRLLPTTRTGIVVGGIELCSAVQRKRVRELEERSHACVPVCL